MPSLFCTKLVVSDSNSKPSLPYAPISSFITMSFPFQDCPTQNMHFKQGGVLYSDTSYSIKVCHLVDRLPYALNRLWHKYSADIASQLDQWWEFLQIKLLQNQYFYSVSLPIGGPNSPWNPEIPLSGILCGWEPWYKNCKTHGDHFSPCILSRRLVLSWFLILWDCLRPQGYICCTGDLLQRACTSSIDSQMHQLPRRLTRLIDGSDRSHVMQRTGDVVSETSSLIGNLSF